MPPDALLTVCCVLVSLNRAMLNVAPPRTTLSGTHPAQPCPMPGPRPVPPLPGTGCSPDSRVGRGSGGCHCHSQLWYRRIEVLDREPRSAPSTAMLVPSCPLCQQLLCQGTSKPGGDGACWDGRVPLAAPHHPTTLHGESLGLPAGEGAWSWSLELVREPAVLLKAKAPRMSGQCRGQCRTAISTFSA